MVVKKFWFFSLCVLLLIAATNGWSVPIRVAVCANALVVLAGVVRNTLSLTRGWRHN